MLSQRRKYLKMQNNYHKEGNTYECKIQCYKEENSYKYKIYSHKRRKYIQMQNALACGQKF